MNYKDELSNGVKITIIHGIYANGRAYFKDDEIEKINLESITGLTMRINLHFSQLASFSLIVPINEVLNADDTERESILSDYATNKISSFLDSIGFLDSEFELEKKEDGIYIKLSNNNGVQNEKDDQKTQSNV